uniref:Beta-glucosidase 13-like n=1 Tax=Paeonia suffruticosa TaxID=45171 RepID=A0AB38Z7E9_PAESU
MAESSFTSALSPAASQANYDPLTKKLRAGASYATTRPSEDVDTSDRPSEDVDRSDDFPTSFKFGASIFDAWRRPEPVARSDFPPSFKFGASSSALQTESYATEGRRGHCTWDEMLGDLPAVHSLILHFLVQDTTKGPHSINKQGVDFYNRLLDELNHNGIMPMVTLCHFDVPSALQKKYNGILGRQFVNDFNDYANLCFQLFGDKVKHWITFNEPSVYCESGYQYEMTGKDEPAIYPYLAAHHLLLAHATSVKTYRDCYQKQQNGKIGISLVTAWFLPYSGSCHDIVYLDPIVTGDYPFSMKSIVRDRLPQFSSEEKKMLEGSYDFIGVNYYTSRYTRALPFSPNDIPVSYAKDQYVEMLTEDKDGVPIGPQSEGMEFMYIAPKWLASILVNLKTKYNNPLIYITENGYPQLIQDKTMEEICDDQVRIDYIKDHLVSIRTALREGVNVDGYFSWTLMDNMEVKGYYYTIGFGLHHVDIPNDFERFPKKSAFWYRKFLSGKRAPLLSEPIIAKEPIMEPINAKATV